MKYLTLADCYGLSLWAHEKATKANRAEIFSCLSREAKKLVRQYEKKQKCRLKLDKR